MSAFDSVRTIWESNGFHTSFFPTAKAATTYLDAEINGKTVGFGGSMTLKTMDLYHILGSHNQVSWQWLGDARQKAIESQVFICSVNASAETGELVNIDGTGDRVASTLFGHEKVYFVIGSNKLVPTLNDAIYRARNIAAPQNAKRLGLHTPCAVSGDRCYQCKSPDRICRIMNIMWQLPLGVPEAEIVCIDQPLGY